ncbi:NAD(P)-binding domain-containing protein [Thalassobaculum salexigens]|uniref:NAD(P)-binding domain-containing protein n=1 Tax=Thalassobaculum salexigens TaxID=455360 RepID=UPI000414CF50|nr:NAD(P)/FAD-dependent oxidoreductase [Thalassobaculum salexigens]
MTVTDTAGMGLQALEQRVAEDLPKIAYPSGRWVPPHHTADGTRILDVLIVGGGQGGTAIAHALTRQRIVNFRIVDQSEPGLEGPWNTYARMATLRSPKAVTGPDLDIPSLTFQAWFEAQHGVAAWEELNKIDKGDWVAYLLWLRRVLDLNVENGKRVERIEPADPYLVATVRDLATGAEERVTARKIVLATGIESSGRWWTPPVMEPVDKRFWAHTCEGIDFAALAGRRVAVLGAGASAFDNAATALEAGAASVTLCVRRPELQRVQPFRWLSFPGFLGHFHTLDDAWRWRFMNYLLSMREAFPRETWQRVARHGTFQLRTRAAWERIEPAGDAVRITTPSGALEADYLIVGTGFDMDMALRPELDGVAEHVARWSDRYVPPAGGENPRLGRYPYLGPAYELLEREPGAAPWLKHIRLFTFGATMSFGPSGASINAMKFAVPRMAAGIARDLFHEDVADHWENLTGFQLPEFLFDGEEGEAAPAVPVIDRG